MCVGGMYVHMYVCKSMCVGGRYVHMCAGPHLQMPEEGIRFLGPGVTSSCEPPDKGVGNQTWVLRKSMPLIGGPSFQPHYWPCSDGWVFFSNSYSELTLEILFLHLHLWVICNFSLRN